MVKLRRNTKLSHAREKKSNPHVSRILDWLVMDYITLRINLPTPQTSDTRTGPRGSRTYGHPAQWASDTARLIADCLDATDEALRDHLGHLPPPPRVRGEARVVGYAYKSLKARLEGLSDYPGTEAFLDEAHEIHATIRRALGHGLQRKTLSLPCPGCDLIGVCRTVYDDRRDVIECPHCGYEIKEQEYGLYARILVDELLAQADANLTDLPLQCDTDASGENLPEAVHTTM